MSVPTLTKYSIQCVISRYYPNGGDITACYYHIMPMMHFSWVEANN